MTATETRKPHFSASQLRMIRGCPLQYFYRYVEGRKIPPGVAMLRGSAVHETVETNLRRKIENDELSPIEEIRDLAADSFAQRWEAEPPLLTVEEVAARLNVSRERLYQWRHRGVGPPAITLGSRLLRFDPDDLEQWINEQRTETGR